MKQPDFAIYQHDFQKDLIQRLDEENPALEQWPLVYVLSDEEKATAYIGETTDVRSRMSAHLKHKQKQKLTRVHLLSSDKFNKSATLDMESKLIRYMAGDGKYNLLNGNLGIVDHSYYQQEYYDELFKRVWNQLWQKGLVQHSLDHITNSDLFKYSPYKSLSLEQQEGLYAIMEALLHKKTSNIIVEGGAGTGKTILAIFLFKMLLSDHHDFDFREFGDEQRQFYDLVQALRKQYPEPKMALVVPMSSFRGTLKKVFRQITGLKSSMVVGPTDITKEKYDIILVDEGHRLRRRVNLGSIFKPFDEACARLGLDKHTATEVDWVVQQAQKTIIFYDAAQSIKPSDAEQSVFDKLKSEPHTIIQRLKSQFRVQGGNAYVDFVSRLLHRDLDKGDFYKHPKYELKLFDHFPDLVNAIQQKDQQHGLSRLIAGYAWPWHSKKDPQAKDIEIDGLALKWNGTNLDWINSQGAVEEVGCIHTTQGYDLNYAGIIFGHEIAYDPEKKEIIIHADNYFDRNGKTSIKDPAELKQFILNIYRTILLRGIKGTYIYVCDPALREYFAQHIPLAQPKVRELHQQSFLDTEDVKPFKNALPFYDIQVAAGSFSEPQNIDDVQWMSIPPGIKPSPNYFICKIYGDSMNKVIPNGSYALFKRYQGGSRNGKIVLVQHQDLRDPDTGFSFTIKEYWSRKVEKDGTWQHEEIRLKPLSEVPDYFDIVVPAEMGEDLKVIGEFIQII